MNTWEFYPQSSCALLTWLGLLWMLVPSCSHRIQLRYWGKYSGSSMKLSGSLWWTVMRPEFIVGDGKLWSIYGRIFSNSSNYSSIILFIHIFKMFLLLRILYVVLFICINNMSVISVFVHSIYVILWVFKADWIHFRVLEINCSFGRGWDLGINILVELFGSWPMFMIVPKDLFYLCLIFDEKWVPERVCFQFSIILNQ